MAAALERGRQQRVVPQSVFETLCLLIGEARRFSFFAGRCFYKLPQLREGDGGGLPVYAELPRVDAAGGAGRFPRAKGHRVSAVGGRRAGEPAAERPLSRISGSKAAPRLRPGGLSLQSHKKMKKI